MTTVAIIAHGELQRDRLFDPGASRDNCLERFKLLRESLAGQGIRCTTADTCAPGEIEVLICHDLHRELPALLRTVAGNPELRLVYIAAEPPFLAPLHGERLLPRLPFDRILTWNDRVAAGGGRAAKCNIGQPLIRGDQIPALPFSGKLPLCCIYSNKWSDAPDTLYGERLRALDYFSAQPGGIDLYGVGWESSTRPSVRASFRGRCREKREVLERYRFALAFENVKDVPGLITEKIFDCFAAGTIPVYYGAPNVGELIPPGCFVDFRRFDGYGELHDFLSGMSEERYRGYLAAVREFLATPQYREFTSVRYAELVLGEIRGLLRRPAERRSALGLKLDLLKLVGRNPHLLRERGMRRLLWDLGTSW